MLCTIRKKSSAIYDVDTTQLTPVIATSANAMDKDIKSALELGFIAYITKPFHVEEFLSTIMAEILQNRTAVH
ncbi:hypothetical protein [Peribacillus sp. SCS-155]|uniref:hypothetical protein n=1 Tax=Peribacillus sedimenti TaxID=3115297 RepID=UPI0039068EA4